MTTYLMRNEHDCGLSALAFATGVDYDRLAEVWDYPNKDNLIDDLRDNPGAHYRVLDKLGIPYKTLTADILGWETLPKNKIVMLLHSDKHPYMVQHWVVLERVTKCYAWYHSGTEGIVKITKEKLGRYIEQGWPEAIYQVGAEKNKKHYLWKAWDWFLSIFLN